MTTNRRPSRSPIPWLVAVCAAAGCEDARRGPAEMAPPDLEPARAALISTLDAWKAGRRETGVLTGSKPAIGVVDATRTGRPLLDYEVVGPLMVAGKARPFAVRLTLDAPRETLATRYLVLGQDPLWVFRQDDFDRMIHWEHTMDPAEKAP